MNILNKYILKKFIRPFLSSFVTLCILIMVSQVFEQLDRFLSGGVGFKNVAGYLLTSLPFQALQILPVACLLGTLFVVGDLARNKEYIAGLAGGLPPEKFLGGILLAGFSISIFALIANETIVPPATRYSTTVYREKIRRLGGWQQTQFTDLFVAGTEGRIWTAKKFDVSSGIMDRPVIDTYNSGHMGPQIDALQAHYLPTKEWEFTDGVMRTYKDDGVSIDSIERFKVKVIALPEKPFDLVIQEPQPEQMNYKNLKKHINRLSQLGVEVRKLQVELMMKLSFPFSCFVVTLLGIPLAMKGKGNRAMGIAAGGILSLAYMGFIQVGKALAQRIIPPLLGAWLGNFVFFIVALRLWARMRKTV